MNFKLLYNKLCINKLLIIISITVLMVFIYNKYISPENFENFEENAATTTQITTPVTIHDKSAETSLNKSKPILPVNNDELMSRLELVTTKLETLINVFSKKTESFTTVETKEEQTHEHEHENEHENKHENEHEDTEETHTNKKNVVKETFISNPTSNDKSNTVPVQGYDSYLYDGYYMKL